MKKYNVYVPWLIWTVSAVEAASEEDATELALDEVYIWGAVGNGGTDKLMAVDGGGFDCEPEQPYISDAIDVTVEEVD